MKIFLLWKKSLCTATMYVLMCASVSAAPTHPYVKELLRGDSIQIQKKFVSKSYRINLYTDANHKVVFFNVRGIQGKVYQLYVFNADGQLIDQAETRNKQTTLLKSMEKGVYLFEVFTDDLRIGNGQIAVK